MKKMIPGAPTLDEEIRQMELQILFRRQTADRRYNRLAQTFKAGLSSPKSLLIAAGAGFIAGELSVCPTPAKPKTAASGVSEQNQKTALRQLLELTALTYSLLHTWPISLALSSARKKSYLPNQTRAVSNREIPHAD